MKNVKEKPNCFANGENLPFKDNSFDFITSFSVIPYVDNIDKFLNEMYLVCKNNAIAIISIMNLRALSRDPNGYYPNKFSSRQLEKKLAEYLKVDHCVVTCNGTSAMSLVISSLELTGEVIIPSFTFIATAHALQWQEITQVESSYNRGD